MPLLPADVSPNLSKSTAASSAKVSFWLGDTAWLIYLALLTVIVHLAVGQRYGIHRDELATLDDARHLAWGYVAYPPWTPFVARVAVALFGPAPAAIRFF